MRKSQNAKRSAASKQESRVAELRVGLGFGGEETATYLSYNPFYTRTQKLAQPDKNGVLLLAEKVLKNCPSWFYTMAHCPLNRIHGPNRRTQLQERKRQAHFTLGPENWPNLCRVKHKCQALTRMLYPA
jgi:hypothetical protein